MVTLPLTFSLTDNGRRCHYTAGRSGGTGRHAVLRGRWGYTRGGSSPPFGTICVLTVSRLTSLDIFAPRNRSFRLRNDTEGGTQNIILSWTIARQGASLGTRDRCSDRLCGL